MPLHDVRKERKNTSSISATTLYLKGSDVDDEDDDDDETLMSCCNADFE